MKKGRTIRVDDTPGDEANPSETEQACKVRVKFDRRMP
jgi:hypothetical protein